MTEALRALGSTLHVHSVRTSSTFFHQLYSPVKKSSRCPPHEETPHLNMTTTTSTWMWVALPPTWRDFLSLRHSKVSGGTQFCTFDKENVNNNPSSSYDYCREHTPLPDICHNRHNQRWYIFSSPCLFLHRKRKMLAYFGYFVVNLHFLVYFYRAK